MSGGRPSGPQTAVGDHPSCTSKARKDGETAGCARSHSEGLGLDGGGVADPNKKEKRKSAHQAGIRYAQGMEVLVGNPELMQRDLAIVVLFSLAMSYCQ